MKIRVMSKVFEAMARAFATQPQAAMEAKKESHQMVEVQGLPVTADVQNKLNWLQSLIPEFPASVRHFEYVNQDLLFGRDFVGHAIAADFGTKGVWNIDPRVLDAAPDTVLAGINRQHLNVDRPAAYYFGPDVPRAIQPKVIFGNEPAPYVREAFGGKHVVERGPDAMDLVAGAEARHPNGSTYVLRPYQWVFVQSLVWVAK